MSRYAVLIVDDDEASHDALGAYLEASGFELWHAYQGAEGLALMRKQRPDVVLLDIQMPVMDGLQMLAEVQKEPALCETPVLLLSSLDRSYLKVKGLELGADDYITKPYDRAELNARIKAALRRSARFRRAQQQLSGSLDELGLAELVQTLDLGNKAAQIVVPDMEGELFIAKGALLHARQGVHLGQPALERLLLMERGRFEVRFGVDASAQSFAAGRAVMVVMEALAAVDHARRVLAAVPTPGSQYLATSSAPALWREWGPLALEAWVVRLEGGLEECAQKLHQAVRDGQLVLATSA